MNIRNVVFAFEQTLWAMRQSKIRENKLGNSVIELLDRLGSNRHGLEIVPEEDFEVQIDVLMLASRYSFYSALGVKMPTIAFDPEKDESQYDLYQTTGGWFS